LNVLAQVYEPIHDDGTLLDDAARANHDGPRNGKDGRFGVDYSACRALSGEIGANGRRDLNQLLCRLSVPHPGTRRPLNGSCICRVWKQSRGISVANSGAKRNRSDIGAMRVGNKSGTKCQPWSVILTSYKKIKIINSTARLLLLLLPLFRVLIRKTTNA
jgi:hypothetical protein